MEPERATWVFMGDSLGAFGEESYLGPFNGHVNGSLVMKELHEYASLPFCICKADLVSLVLGSTGLQGLTISLTTCPATYCIPLTTFHTFLILLEVTVKRQEDCPEFRQLTKWRYM
jgi:hypothetical protein